MQASLDIELKARADAVRAKKKFETQFNDCEMQLEHANKQLSEQAHLSKKLQVTIKEMQDQMDEDARNHEEMREQFGIQERKLTIVMTELDETRNALEANERARKSYQLILNDYNFIRTVAVPNRPGRLMLPLHTKPNWRKCSRFDSFIFNTLRPVM